MLLIALAPRDSNLKFIWNKQSVNCESSWRRPQRPFAKLLPTEEICGLTGPEGGAKGGGADAAGGGGGSEGEGGDSLAIM